jgi:hypothetical protein
MYRFTGDGRPVVFQISVLHKNDELEIIYKSCVPGVLLRPKWSLSLRSHGHVFVFVTKGSENGP